MSTKRSLLALAVLAVLVSALLGWALPQTAADEPEQPIRDGVFVHISHGTDQPHRALMGLKMASLMADDHDVLVYMDVTAVRLAVKTDPTGRFTAMHEGFETSRKLLARLMAQGAHLCVCPSCLEVAGMGKDNLLDGIHLADKAKFFDFSKGRILALDY